MHTLVKEIYVSGHTILDQVHVTNNSVNMYTCRAKNSGHVRLATISQAHTYSGCL